ncbi:hypothetical protein WBG78_14280 [Chryseolinea sp. T2]|uniref:hypothetical protein n=1 Tax=Chryseolinea sp. T2 TaxID=3129255 RepID=UPI00307841BE
MEHGITKYLNGVDYDFFESIDGVYVIREIQHSKGYRYICSYNIGKNQTIKKQIFDKLRRYGQHENNEDWEFHHIVEGRDFADIDFAGRYSEMYSKELPCVMFHKARHSAFTNLFRNKETRLLYRNGARGKAEDRASAVSAKAKSSANHRILLGDLEKLEELYANIYLGDVALQQISRNVFREARKVLAR